jgi:ribosomal protein L11 methyltransferase
MDDLRTYINIHVDIPEEFYEFAIGHLSEYPISGIEEKNDELVITMPSPFFSETTKKMIQDDLWLVYDKAVISKTEEIKDENWNKQWEETISPIIINDEIAISPEWHLSEIKQKYIIIINPKMSFGTGHHATTRMVCSMMKENITQDSNWIDAGTGTGVLAILAVKLGAKSVLAFDNDEWSVDNTIENIELNKCSDKIQVLQSGLLEVNLPESDGITANLYTHLLKPAFPKFYEALKKRKGTLLISGVLVYDKDEIQRAATDAGFRHIKTIQEDEWIAMHLSAGE